MNIVGDHDETKKTILDRADRDEHVDIIWDNIKKKEKRELLMLPRELFGTFLSPKIILSARIDKVITRTKTKKSKNSQYTWYFEFSFELLDSGKQFYNIYIVTFQLEYFQTTSKKESLRI